MGKRTDQTVITALALLYVNECYGEGMILYDKTIEFDRVINENLEKMNSSCGVLYREAIENNFFFTATAEKGKFYAIIRPDADIMKAWAFYGGILPSDVFIASRMPNALETIGIKTKKIEKAELNYRSAVPIFEPQETVKVSGSKLGQLDAGIRQKVKQNKQPKDDSAENYLVKGGVHCHIEGKGSEIKKLVEMALNADAMEVKILYTNWQGVTSYRNIIPKSIEFKSTDWHKEKQWILNAFDVDKQADRGFAIKDIKEWIVEKINENNDELTKQLKK